MKKQVNPAAENDASSSPSKVETKVPAAKKVPAKTKKAVSSEKESSKPTEKVANKSVTKKAAKPAVKSKTKEPVIEVKNTKASNTVNLDDIKIPLKTAKEELDLFGQKANALFSSLLVRMGADKEKILTTLKEEGTQVLSDMIAEAIVDPKFKNIGDIKSADIKTLLKKHTMQKLFNAGRSALTGTIASTVKEKMGAKVNTSTTSNKNGVDEKTTFAQFVHYMIDNDKYKGSNASSAIVAFIASQSIEKDIVLGNASKWETVVAQAKMLEASGLDGADTHRLNVQLVANLFGSELGESFDEHFAKHPVPKASNKKASP